MKQNILETIGSTPMIKLNRITHNLANIYAKAEFLNPSGSIKDRIALEMINAAEEQSILKKNSIIVEPTTGNTGISIAMVAAIKGYKAVIVMPENMSQERKALMKVFGAKIILTPKKDFMEGSIKKAYELSKLKTYVMLNQFKNINNVKAHEKTGKEILEQLKNKKIDAFVAGIGTGGTLMGVSKILKEKYPDVKIFGIMPKEKKHNIQGIGDGVDTELVNWDIVDKIIKVKTKDAIKTSKEVIKKEGLLVGTSSGANVFASLKLRRYNSIVTVLPDRAERYLSGIYLGE